MKSTRSKIVFYDVGTPPHPGDSRKPSPGQIQTGYEYPGMLPLNARHSPNLVAVPHVLHGIPIYAVIVEPWHDHVASGSLVAPGRAGVSQGVLKQA